MAHGFRRERGTGRGYVNVDNPNFPSGYRLSRRQYDKFSDSIGARTRKPTIADLSSRLAATQQNLRENQANVARLAAEVARTNAPQTRGQILAERRRQRAIEREATALTQQLEREDRTAKGQRRYHAALQSYVEEQRSRGRQISAREAAKEPAFREAMELLKGKPNPRGSDSIRRANAEGRKRAVQTLGGAAAFKEVYDRRYGQRVTRVRRSGAGERWRRARGG